MHALVYALNSKNNAVAKMLNGPEICISVPISVGEDGKASEERESKCRHH